MREPSPWTGREEGGDMKIKWNPRGYLLGEMPHWVRGMLRLAKPGDPVQLTGTIYARMNLGQVQLGCTVGGWKITPKYLL
jgi:hypothetical protein